MIATAPITAAIAALDRPEGIRRCLDGLLSGSMLPAEVVIVDQSRDERVADVIRALPAPGVPLRTIRQPRLGLSASRNAGWGAAAEPVVAFTDDDCVPAPQWIAALAPLVEAGGPDAIGGRVLPLGAERPGVYSVSPRVGENRIDFRGRAVPWAVGTGGNFAVRREWLVRIGGFDERLGAGSPGRAAEDADLIYRLLLTGATIRYEPAAIVYHERQTEAQRLQSRRSYGFGIGTFCALHLRRGDLYPARLFASWAWRQCAVLVGSSIRRDRFAARQRMRSLGGGVAGLIHGLGAPRTGPTARREK